MKVYCSRQDMVAGRPTWVDPYEYFGNNLRTFNPDSQYIVPPAVGRTADTPHRAGVDTRVHPFSGWRDLLIMITGRPVGADFTVDGRIRPIRIVFRRGNQGKHRQICPVRNALIDGNT